MTLPPAVDGHIKQGTPTEVLVGRRLKDLRLARGLSLRALADRSGLNVNTLSLVENGKCSPSVGTLQQMALALGVPITAFFECTPLEKRVVFTPAEQRPQARFGSTLMENLGKDLAGNSVQPFLVTLEPGTGGAGNPIVHTGHEFVYCLSGTVHYLVDEGEYVLGPGDCLVFESHLPHCWQNNGLEPAQVLLVLCPEDEREELCKRHFATRLSKKELTMKIAVITDDGKTISRHFGRAPYYMVVTIEEGAVASMELRDKMGHSHFASQPHTEEAQGAGHGMDAASHSKHISMAEAIADCKVLLCGGMGMGAYESMKRLNIQPVVTDLEEIDAAVQAFIDGKLVDHTELLH